MSVSRDGLRIHCDGQDCKRSAPAPVSLRSETGAASSHAGSSPVEGWLYVIKGNVMRHYCPNCHKKYLDEITNAG
jgi:hypothetical protein